MVPGVAFSSAAWIVASGVVGEAPSFGVAPVRTDVERWLRGDGCGTRRCRHAAVLCRPVEENDGQDGEHRHDDRGQYADEHGASLRRAAVRGGTHTDEVFRSSCDVPWRVRAGRRERCDRKASMGPVTRAQSRRAADVGRRPTGSPDRPAAPGFPADGARGRLLPASIRHERRPGRRNADDEAAEGFTLTWHHGESRYTASSDLQRADRAARSARRVLVMPGLPASSGGGCSPVHAQ